MTKMAKCTYYKKPAKAAIGSPAVLPRSVSYTGADQRGRVPPEDAAAGRLSRTNFVTSVVSRAILCCEA